VLFAVGCLGVLGATFTLGVMAGRFWPRGPSAQSATATKEAAPARGADRTARPTEPAPALTFYQDLTAPLTAPPPVKAARTQPITVPEAAAPASSPGAFTIQVGAYKAREPAEALRARLTAAGHDAYVAEIDAAGSVRYRVRVGSFATRETAQRAADKIVAGERTLSAFVTAR
jgi:cell division protein FtsN